MRLLWLCLILHSTFAQSGFGRSYLRNSQLCHQWNCVNEKLRLPDSLPPREEFGEILKALLPDGAWQDVVGKVLDVCYTDRSRRYTNTCPGQALMHCVVDQLIHNCPGDSLRKEDACAPVSSLAGFNYMFSQSRYENLEKNLPMERRPSWFLKNYFVSKCCNLPPLISSSTLTECGFSTLMQYYTHTIRYKYDNVFIPRHTTEPTGNGDSLKIVNLQNIDNPDVHPDPLDCCDMTDFFTPSWRSECDFKLTWEGPSRLVIGKSTRVSSTELPTNTTGLLKHRDLVLLPQSCEKETCVFKKLNIVTASGVDMEAYVKLLFNFTNAQPLWSRARARVLTTCLGRPYNDYEADCEINKILACTFDVLTENCPYRNETDLCKHTKDNIICQISSSKYRPKHRRGVCVLPDLIKSSVLSECGLSSISRLLSADTPTKSKSKKHRLFTYRYKCQDLTPSTSCVMTKMGVMNKYGFIDYFKMKDRIRQFTSLPEWYAMSKAYISAFTYTPMYREHCNSPKKLLNVVDAMVMTCPISKRKNTPKCTKIFTDTINTAPVNEKQNTTQEKLDQIYKHFHHVFLPSVQVTTQPVRVTPKSTKKIIKSDIYNYGILNSKNAPPVQIIDVKPKTVTNKPSLPLTLLPVYMRVPNTNLALRPYNNDSVLRSSPFSLHDQIVYAAKMGSTSSDPNAIQALETQMLEALKNTSNFTLSTISASISTTSASISVTSASTISNTSISTNSSKLTPLEIIKP